MNPRQVVQDRLGRKGLSGDLAFIDTLAVVTDGLPSWWTERGNVLLGERPGALTVAPGSPPPEQAVIAIVPGLNLAQLILWGEAPVVALSGGNMAQGEIRCGHGSTVFVGPATYIMWQPVIDARNGGIVFIEGDGLWSSEVKLFSDDMHAIRDLATGKRVNTFGGTVIVRRHVWLGYGVMLLDGADVGSGGIVGARAVVTRTLPPNSVSVGSPANPIRSGVTWTHEDAP